MILNLLVIPGAIIAIMLFFVMICTFIQSINELKNREYVLSALQLVISMSLLTIFILIAAAINGEIKPPEHKKPVASEFKKVEVEK